MPNNHITKEQPATPCSTVDPEMFFDPARVDAAKAVCASCPLATFDACKLRATEEHIPYGVFAGESGPERMARLGDWVRVREVYVDSGAKGARAVAKMTGQPIEIVCEKLRLSQPDCSKPVNHDQSSLIRELSMKGYTSEQVREMTGIARDRVAAVRQFLDLPRMQAVLQDYAEIMKYSNQGMTSREVASRTGFNRRKVERARAAARAGAPLPAVA